MRHLNILILTLVFPPDNVSTANIVGDLAVDLKAHGHFVTVLTTRPHYNPDSTAEAKQPMKSFIGSIVKTSSYNQIPVFHVFMPRKGSSIILRLLSWAGFHCISTMVGIASVKKPDIIIAPSPPLTIGLSAWFIGLIRRSPYIYNIQEVYPDIAIRLGALRNRQAIRYLKKIEKFVYDKAVAITVIAPRMRKNLLGKGILDRKIKVVPNFVDINVMVPLPKENPFLRRLGLNDQFVVSYAGNFGVPQGLETIIRAADILRGKQEISFIMVGDGMHKKRISSLVTKLQLANVRILPYQPFAIVPQIYSASDVNIVPQAPETGFEAVPSKVYRIMACSRPIIAVTDPTSDLSELIKSADCGIVVPPGSGWGLAEAILWAFQNQKEWKEKGKFGRAYALDHYSREKITQSYEELIRRNAFGPQLSP